MTDLTTLLTRISTLLMDTSNRVWDLPTLTEGVRLALGEYNLAGLSSPGFVPVTLNGLDGANVTTLPVHHQTALVIGAAGYAAGARSVDRAESFELDHEARDLAAWSAARLTEWRRMLRLIFPLYAPEREAGYADPAKIAAETAFLNAQAAAVSGQEARAEAAAQQQAADRAREAARLAELRASGEPGWGCWRDHDAGMDYGDL